MAIGECHIEVELRMEKIIDEGHSMIKITEVISAREILEECKITQVRNFEVDLKVTLRVTILEEVVVVIEKDIIQIMLGGMIEAAVGQD